MRIYHWEKTGRSTLCWPCGEINIRCAATNGRQTSKSEITGLSHVTYVVVCGLKLVAKLVLHAITQLNPMVAEIWTVLLGNGCYIINGDNWKLCIFELCRRPVFQSVRWFLRLINGSGPGCPIWGMQRFLLCGKEQTRCSPNRILTKLDMNWAGGEVGSLLRRQESRAS